MAVEIKEFVGHKPKNVKTKQTKEDKTKDKKNK